MFYSFDFGTVQITNYQNLSIILDNHKKENYILDVDKDPTNFKSTKYGFILYYDNIKFVYQTKQTNKEKDIIFQYLDISINTNLFFNGFNLEDILVNSNTSYYFDFTKELNIFLYKQNNLYKFISKNVFCFKLSNNKYVLIFQKDNLIYVSDEKSSSILETTDQKMINAFLAEYNILFISYSNDIEKQYQL